MLGYYFESPDAVIVPNPAEQETTLAHPANSQTQPEDPPPVSWILVSPTPADSQKVALTPFLATSSKGRLIVTIAASVVLLVLFQELTLEVPSSTSEKTKVVQKGGATEEPTRTRAESESAAKALVLGALARSSTLQPKESINLQAPAKQKMTDPQRADPLEGIFEHSQRLREEATEIFHKFDKANGSADGKLSKSELKKLLKADGGRVKSLFGAAECGYGKLFEALDENQSGTFDLEEWVEFYAKHAKAVPAPQDEVVRASEEATVRALPLASTSAEEASDQEEAPASKSSPPSREL